MDGLKSLLYSRKFWLAVFAMVQAVVLYYFDVPTQIWGSFEVVIMILIAAIAYEDGARKKNGDS